MHRILFAVYCLDYAISVSSQQYCSTLNLSDPQCIEECEYYNNVELYNAFIQQPSVNFTALKNWYIEHGIDNQSVSSFNETLFNYTLRWFTLSSYPYQYFGAVNPEVCSYSLGTYCNIRASPGNAPFMHGCCIPTHCKGDDAIKLVEGNIPCFATFNSTSSGIDNIRCSILPRKWRTGAFVLMIMCIFLFLFIALSTFQKQKHQHVQDRNVSVFVMFDAFCVQTNWHSFIKTRPTDGNVWGFLDGIRVICALHIMWYHILDHLIANRIINLPAKYGVIESGATYRSGTNWLYPTQIPSDEEWHTYLPNDFVYVCSRTLASMLTFFWMGGFFGIRSVIKILTKWKQKRVRSGPVSKLHYIMQALLLIIRRYLRLVIMIIFMILYNLYFAQQIASSYQVTDRDRSYDNCSDGVWYKDLFMYSFIYNSYQWHRIGEQARIWRSCVAGSWYPYADWFLFMYLPLIAFVWVDYKHTAGFVVCVAPMLACIVGRLYAGFRYHLQEVPIYLFITRNAGNNDAQSYLLPWSWMVYYYMGAAFMLSVIYMQNNIDVDELQWRLSRKRYWFLMAFSFGLMSTYICTPYDQYRTYPDNNWTATQSVMYYALAGTSYCIGFTLFVFCLRFSPKGYYSVVKAFLSCKIFQVWSKLTYIIFLIHMPIFVPYRENLLYPMYFSWMNTVIYFISFSVIVTLVAFLIFMCIENPMAFLIGKAWNHCINPIYSPKAAAADNLPLIRQTEMDEFDETHRRIYSSTAER